MAKIFDRKPPPVVDLKSLARNIGNLTGNLTGSDPATDEARHMAVVQAFAPVVQREAEREAGDSIVERVLRFSDLPTKKLDDIIAAAELELSALKQNAQIIRNSYVKHTSRVAEDVQRLRDEVKLSMELMHSLRKQCGLIDNNAKALMEESVEAFDEPNVRE